MYDFASPKRHSGVNHSGVVCFDHTTPKDAYYLYRAMWNPDEATLHIADGSWRERRDTLQQIDVYSSVGEPMLLVGGGTITVGRVAPSRCRADSVVIRGRTRIEGFDVTGAIHDVVEVHCGGY